MKFLIPFLLFLFYNSDLYSQVGRYPNPTGSNNFPSTTNQSSEDSIEQEELEDLPPDTIRIYTPFQLKKFTFFSDTSLHNQFHIYDEVKLQEVPYLNIGNNGSPNRMAMYKMLKYQGLDIGAHTLDIYKHSYENTELRESKRALTDIRFAQKQFLQTDLQLALKFHKTFQNVLHLNIYLRSLNYSGELIEQINKDRSYNFNIWYHSPKGNYDLVINFLNNDIKLQDNGGIYGADSLMKESFYRSNTKTINTNLIDGRSRQRENAFSLQNGFNINLGGSKLGFTHYISTSNQLYSYLDTKLSSSDSIAYYDKFYSKDTIHINIETKGIINDFRLDGLIKDKSYLMAGLRHEFHDVNQSTIKSNLNLLFLHGKYEQTLGKNIQFGGIGQWGLLENFGEYYLKGDINLNSKQLGALEGHAVFQRSPVPLLFQTLYTRGKLIYANNNFGKPLSNQIGGSFHIAAIALKAGIDQSIISNTIYLDADRKPKQESAAISITSVHVDKTFNIGKFHTRHRAIFQFNSKNDVLRYTPWFLQNIVYYQSVWFKGNMSLLTGLDSRVIPSFKTKAYFPLTGNFYNDASNSNISSHPSIDFFFNFQLKSFRGFFKYEGLEYLVYPTGKVFYETLFQPLQRSNIRLGFTWHMRD